MMTWLYVCSWILLAYFSIPVCELLWDTLLTQLRNLRYRNAMYIHRHYGISPEDQSINYWDL